MKTVFVYLGIFLLGLLSLFKLEVGFYPEISIPYAYIVTKFEGMPPDEVETAVSIPLENAFSSVKNIKSISSTSKRGLSVIKLEFQWDTNMNVAGSDIRNKIDSVYPFLPDSASRPVLSFKEVSDSNAMMIAVFPKDDVDFSHISSIVERELKSRIISLGGVAQVKLFGYAEPEIKIDLDYQRLMALDGQSPEKIASIISQNVFRQPVGKIEDGEKSLNIKATTDIKSPGDLASIPLDASSGLQLGNIASIMMGEKKRTSIFRLNGRKGICLQVIKTGGSGLFGTCGKIKKAIPEFEKIYANLFDIVIVEDNSAPLRSAIVSLVLSIAAGIICAAGTMIYFIRDKHIAGMVILALPASLMPVFLFMYFGKMTLNIITLSALAIGAGMVFDNSIVVIDRLLQERNKPLPSYRSAAKTSASAILGSTITTIIIFIPIVMIPGLMGKVFTDLAITIIFFLASSCAVSLTLIPTLFTIFEKYLVIESCKLKLVDKYKKYMAGTIGNKKCPIAVAGLSLVPVVLAFFINFEVIPSVKEKTFEVKVEFPYGYSFDKYSEWAGELEKELLDSGLCSNVVICGGYDNSSVLSEAENERDLNTFIFKIESRERDKISKIIEASGWNAYPVSDNNFLSKLIGDNNFYSVSADDRGELESKVASVMEKAARDGIEVNVQRGLRTCPEYRFSVLQRAAKSEITPYDIFSNISFGTDGHIVADMEIDGRKTDIRLRYGREFVDTVGKVSSLALKNGSGMLLTEPLVKVAKDKCFFALTRLDRKNILYLQFVPDTKKDYGTEKFSKAVKKSQGKNIAILFSGALIFMYFVLAIQFESFKKPLLILLTIPPCMAGSLFLLFMTGKSLNISSFLGLMILSGTAVNSGILILSDVQRGMTVSNAAIARLTTVFLTVVSTVTALLPVALFDKNPIQNCASVSLLGGLLFGTASLFMVMPIFIKEAENGSP